MKKKRLLFIIPFFLVAVSIGIYLLNGCQKDVGSISYPVKMFEIHGKVIDFNSKVGIQNVQVVIGNTIIVTNQNGEFIFKWNQNNTPSDQKFFVAAKKDGYITNTVTFDLGYGSNTNIPLVPLNNSVLITSTGGGISLDNSESFNSNKKIELTIPAGAIENNTQVSVTQLKGITIAGKPSYLSNGYHCASVVYLSPQNLTLLKSSTISMPLPLKLESGTKLPLLIYDEKTFEWKESGINGVVDASGVMAVAEISKFATYSIGLEGTYEEHLTSATKINSVKENKSKISSAKIKSLKTDTIFCTQDSIIYPNGFPHDILNIEWAYNTVSAITSVGGVAIIDPSCFYSIYVYGNAVCNPVPEPTDDCLICTPIWDIVGYDYIIKETLTIFNLHLNNIIIKWRPVWCIVDWDCENDPNCPHGGSGN